MSLVLLSSRKRKTLALAGVVGIMSLMLSGCAVSPEDEAKINSVTTALPQDIEGCTFLGDVTNSFSQYSIEGARDDLKLKTANLGGNQLVETHLVSDGNVAFDPFYDRGIIANMNGFFMSGRAYYCPAGKGVLKALPSNVHLLNADGSISENRTAKPGFAAGPYQATQDENATSNANANARANANVSGQIVKENTSSSTNQSAPK